MTTSTPTLRQLDKSYQSQPSAVLGYLVLLAFNTGTVKPAVLLKWIPRVFTGLLQQCETRFSCFKSCFP